MRDLRRLIFHIGMEKTGTTSLQASLYRNQAALKRHSILYPKHNLAFGWENHKPLVACYDVDYVSDKWLVIDPSRRVATIASLISEIEASEERTAIISAEHFSSRFREPQIRQLAADFKRFDCRVVVVIRDHVARLRSAYESYVVNGGALKYDEFAEGATRFGSRDLRFADLVEDWKRVFGHERVELISYGPDVIQDVLSSIAPGLATEPNLDDFRLRVSADGNVIAALRLANAVTTNSETKRLANAAWSLDRQRRLQIKAWLQHSLPSRPNGALALDGERLRRLSEMAALDTARLEADHGFILKAPEIAPSATCGNDEQVAELLARALCARAAQSWSKASVIGTGLAIGVTLRDEVIAICRKLVHPS